MSSSRYGQSFEKLAASRNGLGLYGQTPLSEALPRRQHTAMNTQTFGLQAEPIQAGFSTLGRFEILLIEQGLQGSMVSGRR